jgi:hypothetical protein
VRGRDLKIERSRSQAPVVPLSLWQVFSHHCHHRKLTRYKLSNFVGGGGVVEDTGGQVDVRHRQTLVQAHVAATGSHSSINYAQRDQTNNYSNDYSTHIYQGCSKYFTCTQIPSCQFISDCSVERRDKIRQWLSPTIPSTNYDEALETRLQETGMWFIGDNRFLEWKENADSLLWLYGKRMFSRIGLASGILAELSI